MVCAHMRCTPKTTPPDETIGFGGFARVPENSHELQIPTSIAFNYY